MSTSDHTDGRRFRFWPRTFLLQVLLVVVIVIVLGTLLLLTATVSESGSLGIVETGGTGTGP